MKLIFAIILLSIVIHLKAQDTIMVNKPGTKVRTTAFSVEGTDQHSIQNKVFVSNDVNLYKGLDFSDILNCIDLLPISRNFTGIHNLNDIDTSTSLTIDTCIFIYQEGKGKYHGDITKPATSKFSDIFLQHFVSEDDFNIEAIKSGFHFGNCLIKGKLQITDNPKGFSIVDSKILDGIDVFYSNAMFYTIRNSNIGGRIDFEYTKLDNLQISECTFNSNADIVFKNDTITNLSIDTIKQKANISFDNCIINGTVDFNVCDSLNVKFINVSFGENAILSINADSILFDRCIGLSNSNVFSYSNPNTTNISFHNTDFSRLQMEYSNLKFFSIDSNSNDALSSMYERSLSKFMTEGKKESYQNVDIDYKKYMYSNQGFRGAVTNFFDRFWWNYSYSKSYIIYWSLFFIIIFFTINVLIWENINIVYPIMNDNNFSGLDDKNHKINLITVFLFTVYVFFSLRINFDKLNYSKPKTLSWFFIQYLVGLICMFFIANAILKIG